MYNILIIEDEEIERNALVSLIQNKFHNHLCVYSLSNGADALQLYNKYPMHIVMSDINLPGMNGLEVIQEMKKTNQQTLFLVLTSYNYFEYAHNAIKIGVEDFILKPAKEETLYESIMNTINKIESQKLKLYQTSKLLEKIENMKPIMESDCLFSIIRNDKVEVVQNYLSLLNIESKSGFCIILDRERLSNRLQLFKREIEDNGYMCMYDAGFDYQILFIFSLKKIMEDEIQVLNNKIEERFLTLENISVGDVFHQCGSYYHSYRTAIEKLKTDQSLTLKNGNEYETVQKKLKIEALCDAILSDFMRLDSAGLKKQIQQFCLDLQGFEPIDIIQYLNQFNESLVFALNREFKLHSTNTPVLLKDFHDTSMDSLQKYVGDIVNALLESINQASEKSSHVLVKKALSYISLNYTKTITLNDVASYLNVTPFYVSKLLSAHIDKNFTDLVTEYRIEKSKELLNSDMQIKDIAFSLGFKSHNYFTKVFRKVTGLTPKEYKTKYYLQH